MLSVWSDTARLPEFKSLGGNIKTDVLVVGGGIAGILCAYMLRQSGVECVIAEANRICSGVTENTTAKITSQHGLIYNKLIKRFGTENTRLYLEANQEALKKYSEMCADIDCDFTFKDSFVYSVTDEEKLEREMEALGKIGFNAKLISDMPLPFSVKGAVCFEKQAQFNPLKFLSAIASSLNIYENTPVRKIAGKVAFTDQGSITAENIIIASHFPFINKHGSYFLKMHQSRSYVIALENAGDVNGMYVDEDKKGLSLRNYGDLLILGGEGHRTGKKSGAWHSLEESASKYYPGSSVMYRWAAQDCMTVDDAAYIGHYSKNTPDMYVATGFGKWGMTTSMVAATILCDMICGKDNRYAHVFSPSRNMLHPALAVNAAEAVINLVNFSQKRCPHMGCALKWNKAERTWDCPCHGSRFRESGKLISGPAQKSMKRYRD